MTEQNRARNILYRQMMQVPHRNYAPAVKQFRNAFDEDPDFVMRACAYLALGNTKIRDQEDIGIITLLQSPAEFRMAREAGRVLLLGSDVYDTEPENLSGVDPYRVFRILQFIATSDHKVSRLARALAQDYIAMLEANPQRFDGVALRNRKALKWLYVHNHIQPSERAQAILFDDNPPDDSSFAVLKEIANSDDPAEQARLVIEHKIPYRIAVSVLPKMTPVVGVALISAMSPTEALNSRNWVERSGLLEMEDVKNAYMDKISRATRSVASAEHRASSQGSDEEVQAVIEKAKQTAVDRANKIEGDVLIIVDRSGSMTNAISTAVEFGARIAPLCTGNMMVVTHNNVAQEIRVKDPTSLRGWKDAFMGIRANGGTATYRAVEFAIEKGFNPQKIVLITDGEETAGSFRQTVEKYEQNSGIEPSIIQITVDSNEHNTIAQRMEGSYLRYDQLVFTGDYYIFDQVETLLAGKPMKSIVETILETELPCRR